MKIFVDTAAWLALNDRSDQLHPHAAEMLAAIRTERISLVTSDYVLDESLTIIRVRVSHTAAVAFGQSIFGSSIVELLSVGSDDRLAAWEIFRKYVDQKFSFTDCTSFALMRKLRLKTVFTFDEHFPLMGFDGFRSS